MSTERQCPRCGASVDVRASRCSACGSRLPKLQAARRGQVIPTFVDARTPDGPMKAILLPPAGTVHVHVMRGRQTRDAYDRVRSAIEKQIAEAFGVPEHLLREAGRSARPRRRP